MQTNEITYAKTHAEFLNKKFGTNYKAWMKCCYKINTEYEVWMVRFNGQKRDSWKNFYLGDIIKEENCDITRKTWEGTPLPQTLYHKKLVFEVIENDKSTRKYVFKGVYKYQIDVSNPYKTRIYKKISNKF